MRRQTIMWIALLLGCPWALDPALTAQAPAASPGSILDDALSRLGLERAAITQPRAEERDYNLICKLPVIDSVMERPFAFPLFWKGFTDQLELAAGRSSHDVYTEAVRVLNTGVSCPAQLAAPSAARDRESFDREIRSLFPGLAPDALEQAWKDDPRSPALYAVVGDLCAALKQASDLRARAFAGLGPDDIALLRSNPTQYFFDGDTYRFLTVSAGDMSGILRVVDTVRKIDFAPLLEAGSLLLKSTEALMPRIEEAAGAVGETPGTLFDLETPAGRVVVAGAGSDSHDSGDAILDLGGDDVYGDGAGGALQARAGVSWIIDRAGNDAYRSEKASAQGDGTLGAALLYDGAGNDVYDGRRHAQGSAFAGVGVLEDRSGDDVYTGGFLCQGAGVFGVGLLLDRSGADAYMADGFAQGFGSTLGIGLLYDVGGSDRYACGLKRPDPERLEFGNGQGAGLGVRSYPWIRDPSIYGGLGFLVDDQGNDTYEAQTFSQAGSYFLSMGALLDREGNDRYKGLGEHHQGGGIHACAAIFADLGGDDVYNGHNSSQAAANDRSVAWMLDFGGNDRYEGPTGNSQAYSRKGESLSVLVDVSGDDAYACPEQGDERGQAYAQLMSTPYGQSTVLFFDLQGKDRYNQAGRGDNTTWQPQPGVVGTDVEQLAPCVGYDEYDAPVNRAGLDPLAQFHVQANDKMPLGEKDFVVWVETWLARGRTGDWQRAFYPLEQVTLAACRNELTPAHYNALARWLVHPYRGFRLTAVKLIGRSEVPALGRSMMFALKQEHDPYVRMLMIEALGRLGTVDARNTLVTLARGETNAALRRVALTALEGLFRKQPGVKEPAVFVRALDDVSPEVRFTAARMLARMRSREGVKQLLAFGKDPDVWVRRAAAHALMAAGEKAGIPMLISTMDFYSLDNSYYNYGQDIGNLLKQYTNVTFTRKDDKGVDQNDYLNQARWNAWWEAEGSAFVIEPFLEPARLIDDGDLARRDKKTGEARKAYERALALRPGYLLAEERLKELGKE